MKRIAAAAWLLGASCLSAGCFGTLSHVDLSDAGVTARLRDEFKVNHPEVSLQYVDIDTHVGVVTISGIVSSEEDKRTILFVARRLKGVKEVLLNLLVRQ